MAVDQEIAELINADIDGEISAADREKLRGYLQSQPEAQELYDEIASLCQSLDAMEAVAPPPHLKHVILDSLQAPPVRPRAVRPLWRRFLVAPPLHYAGTFAAGSLVTFLIISSNQISEHVFDDVTDLVGTVGTEVNGSARPGDGIINLTGRQIAGTVKAHRAGPIMVIDFDLASVEPVEIVAEFTDRDIWFNGFAQLESDGTTVSAETGRVSLRMTGKRRYAMYLYNASGGAATVKLRFYATGELIYEDDLSFASTD